MSYTTSALLAIGLSAVLSVATAATSPTYQFRQAVPGLSASAPSQAPAPASASLRGDGTSKAGGCASGEVGCATMQSNSSFVVAADGLTVTCNSWGAAGASIGSKALSSGKWYWEAKLTTTSGWALPGLIRSDFSIAGSGTCAGCNGNMWSGSSPYLVEFPGDGSNDGYRGYSSVSRTSYTSGVPVPTGSTLGFALDLDGRTLTTYVNGSPRWKISGIPTGASWTPTVSTGGFAGDVTTLNFGQSNFEHPVPVGYNAGVW